VVCVQNYLYPQLVCDQYCYVSLSTMPPGATGISSRGPAGGDCMVSILLMLQFRTLMALSWLEEVAQLLLITQAMSFTVARRSLPWLCRLGVGDTIYNTQTIQPPCKKRRRLSKPDAIILTLTRQLPHSIRN